MEISFSELKEKEIINVFDGKKLGRIVDILFDNASGIVRGIVVPGERKIFRKNEDVFVPLERLKKIGDDVILVNLKLSQKGEMFYETANYYNEPVQNERYPRRNLEKYNNKGQSQSNNKSFVRYKRIDSNKYK